MTDISTSIMSFDENTKETIALANVLSDKQFALICDSSISYLTQRNKLTKLKNLNETIVEIDNYKIITKWLIKALSVLFKKNYEQIKASFFEELVGFGLDASKVTILKKLWKEKSESLNESLEKDYQSFLTSQLVDIEWKFGVIASTSEIDKIGNPFLQLKLVLDNSGQLETHYMEMTLQTFYLFLHEMNKAKSQIDFI